MIEWTKKRVERLETLWAEGHVASAIARMMGDGLTRSAVIGKANRLKLEARALTPGEAACIGNRLRHGQARSRPIVAAFAPPAPPELDVIEQPARRVRLLDLKDGDCRWPLGETAGPDTLFCGCAQLEGSPYCAWHKAKATIAGSSTSDRKRATYYARRAA